MIVEFIKLHIKKIVAVSLSFTLFICFLFWKDVSIPGEETEPLYQYSWPEKLSICEIERKKVYINRDSLNISLFHLLFYGSRDAFYTYHLLYRNIEGEEINFLTYRIPFVFGIDVIPENIGLAIEDTKEKIIIYYDKEPVGGFSIDRNPFSKKIELRLEKEWVQKMKKEGLCK